MINLSKKLDIETTTANKETRIIIIEMGQSTIGMIVDSCNEVLRISHNQIEPAPTIITKKIQAEYIKGVGILKDRLIILLDLIKVIGIAETEKATALVTL